MPSADTLLDSAARLANGWRSLAVFWHVYFGLLTLGMVTSRRLSHRVVAYALVLPLASVSAMAWSAGNPFNGGVFSGLAVGLTAIARGIPDHIARTGSRAAVAAGVLLVAFAWIYPHFLETTDWAAYLVAAPLGLLPCPTLAGLIGVTIALRGLDSAPWCVMLGLVGLAYGLIGIFGLGVALDVGLAAGALVLLLSQLRQNVVNRRLAISRARI
jgi:hypothetical protein